MPGDASSFRKKHNQGLSDAQARRAAEIANKVLAETGDEAWAANAAVARRHWTDHAIESKRGK
jgi:hypothetical protein